MLAQFCDVPGAQVVGDPQFPLMLKPFSPGLSRGVDPPFVWEGEFPDEFVLDEELDDPLAQVAGGKGPHWRSLPLDLDTDICNGLFGHPGL